LLLLAGGPAWGQSIKTWSLTPADSLHRPRVRAAAIGAGIAYPVAMTGLWQAWYANYPTGRFRVFNDMQEWGQMDKMGHWFSTYQEARLGWNLARWAGFSNRRSAWIGFGLGQLVQTSFEVMDGFSEQWGFSWGDVGFNTLGAAMFTAQQIAWKEQRVTMKMSGWPVRYDDTAIEPYRGTGPPVTLSQRAADLYGTGPINLFLKNYNTLVVWTSVNPRSFMPEKAAWMPRWLNVAVGMGADNLFAGFGYEWQADKNCQGPDCTAYRVDPAAYPRTRQWMLSLDVDLTRIPVKNRYLRTLLHTVNIFKVPAPALVWSDRGRMRFYPVYF
jgi:uncharacterized protein YfiM (DUF2279 family)